VGPGHQVPGNILMSNHYLIGDVGGTKTELAIYEGQNQNRKYSEVERFLTRDFVSLAQMIAFYLGGKNLHISNGVLAIAGPVLNDKVTLSSSNLPWEVDANQLKEALQIPNVRLINDLEALARGIPLLSEQDLHNINPGIKKSQDTLAVIAPGTGLGEAFLIWDGANYLPCISEGAHVNFGPRTETEIEILKYMKNRHQHVTYEMLCSGLGIPSIYQYLKEASKFEEPTWFCDQMANSEDKTPGLIDAALDLNRPCEIAVATIKQFVSILSAETGNLVLKTMATGGVYLGGGIPKRILPFLDAETFLYPFSDKGIMTEMMHQIPVQVILNTNTPLIGCIDYLLNQHNRAKLGSG